MLRHFVPCYPGLHHESTHRRDLVIAVAPGCEESPVFYLQFRDGGWSAPVEVGGARVDSFFGSVWDAVQIATDGEERVFVTWPVRGGIEGRWVRVRGE